MSILKQCLIIFWGVVLFQQLFKLSQKMICLDKKYSDELIWEISKKFKANVQRTTFQC
jgi:hypothetical protein